MSKPLLGSATPGSGLLAMQIDDLLAEIPWPIALVSSEGLMLALNPPLLDLVGALPVEQVERQPLATLLSDEVQALFGPAERSPQSLSAHLRQPHGSAAVKIEAIWLPDDAAGRMAAIIYPQSILDRREQLIREFNLIAPDLLAAQSPAHLYERATRALTPLGMGMLVARQEPDGAALRCEYIGLGPATTALLSHTAQVNFSDLRIPSTAPLFAEVLARRAPFFAASFQPLIEALLLPEAATNSRVPLRLLGITSCILAPIEREQARSVLMIWSHALSQTEVPFVGAFAYQLGAVLAQIELRQRMETQVQRLNSLATTARAVTALGSLEEALRTICVQAQELLAADFARVAVPVAGADSLHYIMSNGSDANLLLDVHIPIHSSVSGSVFLRGTGRMVTDIQAEQDVYAPVKARTSTRSALYQPLKHQGRVLGVLIVGSLETNHFTAADLDYLGRYAEHAAVAMANAQLHSALQQSELELQRQRRELAALLELSQAVNHSLDLDTLLGEGLRVLEELGLATVAIVLLVDDAAQDFELRAARGVPAGLQIQRLPLASVSGDILREGRLRVLSQRDQQQIIDQYGITDEFLQHTAVYIPLIVSDKQLGVLGVSRPKEQQHTERELRLLQALTNQLAQAVARAKVHLALQKTAALNARLYRQAEEVRSHLNALVHNTPDLLLTIRPDMTIHLLNPERITANDTNFPELVEGQSFLDFVPAELHADLLARWQQILAGQPQSIDLEGIRSNGQPYNLLLSAVLIADYGEVFVIVKDVTDQRRNEAQIRQNEKLAALGRMVAGAAHELNNPLAAILGLAQLQIAEGLAPAQHKDLERIERAALRARSIVQQLLTFARAQPPEPQPVPIARLVRDTLDRLAGRIAQDQVVVTIDIADNLPDARGDHDQLEQVLFNIIQNALQALAGNQPDLPRALHIEARQAGPALRLALCDTGPGIAPEHLPRVFDPFFTTRIVGQGTGLGLAITHAIVQQHEGRIWVTSQVGQGTTFTLELPLAGEPSRPISPPEPPELPAVGTRLLLVEDEEIVRSVVSRTLARHEYLVDAVGSGEEALTLALAHDYALVISDLQMPGIDGAALYERLAQARPSLRWLIVTGDTMGERSHSFLERTALPALAKPFTQEQLLARVAECIDAAR